MPRVRYEWATESYVPADGCQEDPPTRVVFDWSSDKWITVRSDEAYLYGLPHLLSAKEVMMHPSSKAILRFFEHQHLRDPQALIAGQCEVLARGMAEMLQDTPHGAELTVGLRKLLEAKDCFVRASLPA